MVPGGDFLFGADAALFGGVLAQEVEGHVAQGGQMGGGVAGAHAAFIFAQGDIEHPVEGVFDAQWPRMARASSGACGGRLLR